MDWKYIELKDILDKTELKALLKLINKRDWEEVRIFLNDRRLKLEKKGVFADYLYYFLLNSFGKNGR